MADKDDKKIAKPTCPKCGKHEFKHEAVKSSGSSAGVYVVFITAMTGYEKVKKESNNFNCDEIAYQDNRAASYCD